MIDLEQRKAKAEELKKIRRNLDKLLLCKKEKNLPTWREIQIKEDEFLELFSNLHIEQWFLEAVEENERHDLYFVYLCKWINQQTSRRGRFHKLPGWSLIRDMFCIGSTSAREIWETYKPEGAE